MLIVVTEQMHVEPKQNDKCVCIRVTDAYVRGKKKTTVWIKHARVLLSCVFSDGVKQPFQLWNPLLSKLRTETLLRGFSLC